MQIADRLASIPFSGIRKILEAVDDLERKGRDVIRLEIGRPDFDTPAHIKAAAADALAAGKVHYSSNYGILELREAITRKLSKENGLSYDASSEVIVTSGAVEAVAITMMGLLNPGDEILIPDPYWVSYGPCAQMAGAIPISVPSRFADGFYPRIEDIEARITSKTRMLVINSPHNPTGAVYGKDILDKLARLAIKHNLYVLSDEIYERIIYDGNEHISIGALPNMRERTITINGMSKIYSMTGWRLGYVAAEKSVIEALVRIRQNTTACATTFAQWGGLEALNGSQEESTNMVAEFERRRNFLFAALQKIPGLQVVKPGGAFYFLVSVEELMQPAEQVAMYLLEEAGVAVVPGTAFGNYGEGLLRISYANSYQNLVLAAARMCAALEKCHAIS